MQEKQEMQYVKKLWGNVESLHERYKKKKTCINNFMEIINTFQNACQTFSKSLQSSSLVSIPKLIDTVVFCPDPADPPERKISIRFYI